MLQVLLRYFSGIFQVLFRYLPHLNKLTKSHIHEKAKETFVLSIKKIGMIQEVENASGFFYKIPQVHQVLFRYLPEVTGQKVIFTRSNRHDQPGEPIKSTQTLAIVLQISCQSLKNYDIVKEKISTLIISRYMQNQAVLDKHCV